MTFIVKNNKTSDLDDQKWQVLRSKYPDIINDTFIINSSNKTFDRNIEEIKGIFHEMYDFLFVAIVNDNIKEYNDKKVKSSISTAIHHANHSLIGKQNSVTQEIFTYGNSLNIVVDWCENVLSNWLGGINNNDSVFKNINCDNTVEFFKKFLDCYGCYQILELTFNIFIDSAFTELPTAKWRHERFRNSANKLFTNKYIFTKSFIDNLFVICQPKIFDRIKEVLDLHKLSNCNENLQLVNKIIFIIRYFDDFCFENNCSKFSERIYYIKFLNFYNEYIENYYKNFILYDTIKQHIDNKTFIEFCASTIEREVYLANALNIYDISFDIFKNVNKMLIYDNYQAILDEFEYYYNQENYMTNTNISKNISKLVIFSNINEIYLYAKDIYQTFESKFDNHFENNRKHDDPKIDRTFTLFVNKYSQEFMKLYLGDSFNNTNINFKIIVNCLINQYRDILTVKQISKHEKNVPELLEKFTLKTPMSNIFNDSSKIIVKRLTTRYNEVIEKYVDFVKTKQKNATKFLVEEFINIIEDNNTYISNHFNNIVYLQEKTVPFYKMMVNTAITIDSSKNLTCVPIDKIGLYVDGLLTNSGLLQNELTEAIKNIANLIMYISDCDIYENIHRSYLIKRVIGLKAKKENEEEFNSTCKQNKRFQSDFTRNWEIICNTIEMADKTSKNFNDFIGKNTNYQFNIFPSNVFLGCDTNATIHDDLTKIAESFEKFHLIQNKNKKLLWTHKNGTAVITCYFAKSVKEITMSLIQASIVLLLNTEDDVSIENILKSIKLHSDKNINFEQFQNQLIPMLYSPTCNILLRLDANKNIIPNTEKLLITNIANEFITINKNFISKEKKMTVPIMSKQIFEKKNIEQEIEQSRAMAYKAAIVRVLKSHKELMFNDLWERVVKILEQKFTLNHSHFKKVLENAIDTDFCERSDDDRDLIKYIA